MNIKGIAIALSIMALLPVTVYWGTRVVSVAPKYNDYHSYGEKKASQAEQAVLEQQYKQLQEQHEKWYLIISLIVGLLAILLGLVLRVPFLDFGLIIGGSITILIGSWGYLVVLGDVIKLIATAGALIALIFGAYRMFKS